MKRTLGQLGAVLVFVAVLLYIANAHTHGIGQATGNVAGAPATGNQSPANR